MWDCLRKLWHWCTQTLKTDYTALNLVFYNKQHIYNIVKMEIFWSSFTIYRQKYQDSILDIATLPPPLFFFFILFGLVFKQARTTNMVFTSSRCLILEQGFSLDHYKMFCSAVTNTWSGKFFREVSTWNWHIM